MYEVSKIERASEAGLSGLEMASKLVMEATSALEIEAVNEAKRLIVDFLTKGSGNMDYAQKITDSVINSSDLIRAVVAKMSGNSLDRAEYANEVLDLATLIVDNKNSY